MQYDYLRAFGLGEPTGLNLPGESRGDPADRRSTWAGDERYTLSFGQGVAVNAVQMASVYATIANNGVRVQPTLIAGHVQLERPVHPGGAVAVPPGDPAEDGARAGPDPAAGARAGRRRRNAPWGVIPGYAVAAKTGTSASSEPGARTARCASHGSSYIGMAPGNGPQVVVAANVQDPDSNTAYFGDNVAGPVFYNVMKFALQTLQIPPQPGLVAPYVRLNAP